MLMGFFLQARFFRSKGFGSYQGLSSLSTLWLMESFWMGIFLGLFPSDGLVPSSRMVVKFASMKPMRTWVGMSSGKLTGFLRGMAVWTILPLQWLWG